MKDNKKGASFWIFSLWSAIVFTYSSWIFVRGAARFLPEMLASAREKHARSLDISGVSHIRFKVGKELTAYEVEDEETSSKERKVDPLNRGMSKYKGGLTWYNYLDDALEVCRIQDKQVMVIFTASDWSIPCVKLREQVLSTSRFRILARKNFILVDIDTTRRYKRFFEQKMKLKNKGKKIEDTPNFSLKRAAYLERKLKKFSVESFPTIIVFSSREKNCYVCVD